jgi:hypothetical protein
MSYKTYRRYACIAKLFEDKKINTECVLKEIGGHGLCAIKKYIELGCPSYVECESLGFSF